MLQQRVLPPSVYGKRLRGQRAQIEGSSRAAQAAGGEAARGEAVRGRQVFCWQNKVPSCANRFVTLYVPFGPLSATLGAFTPWWHVQFCWLPIVNSRTLPYLRPVLDSSQWDGSSGVVYQCNWKKLRAISVTYFPNQSILCSILLCPPTPVMLCF